MKRIRLGHLALPVLLVALAATAPASAGDPPKKESEDPGKVSDKVKAAGLELLEDAKAAGHEIRRSKVGRQVEGAAREIGHDAAGASKKGWDKTKSFSASAAEDVKRATREFWDDVIRAKEAVAEKLRKENADLKSKNDGSPARPEPPKEAR